MSFHEASQLFLNVCFIVWIFIQNKWNANQMRFNASQLKINDSRPGKIK